MEPGVRGNNPADQRMPHLWGDEVMILRFLQNMIWCVVKDHEFSRQKRPVLKACFVRLMATADFLGVTGHSASGFPVSTGLSGSLIFR